MDFLKVTVIVLFVILTIITVHIHPDMHQPMILEDADFKVTRISDNLTTKNIPVTKQPALSCLYFCVFLTGFCSSC